MEATTLAFKDNAHTALAESGAAVGAGQDQDRLGRQPARAAADRLPEFEALRDQGRDIKNHSLAHLDLYLEAFEAKVIEPAAAACTGRATPPRRGPSCWSCAGGRRPHGDQEQEHDHRGDRPQRVPRGATGCEPIETDLGEYILQISGQPPSHIVGPAVHMTKDEISDLFAAAPWRPAARRRRPISWPRRAASCASTILAADVGITGANFLIAETGSAITVTNEGNAELTQGLPRTHIVVASLEKVVPTMEDAFTLLRLLARSATGQEFSTYTTVMTGPKRPGDLDGPDRFHVVLLDNGRIADAGQRAARDAALHPLRRLHEPLPGLSRDRRPCLWLGLSRADGLGADAAVRSASSRPGRCPTPRPSAAAARRSARSASRCRS